jgi:hypothetical protein
MKQWTANVRFSWDDWYEQAAAALGGEARLRDISRISVSGISVLYQREQSERPEGPWLPTFTEFTDVRDVTTSTTRRIARTRGFVTENDAAWSPELSSIIRNGVAFRASAGAPSPAPMPWDLGALPADLGPEHAVIAALDASDLRTEPDIQLHGSLHHVPCRRWSAKAWPPRRAITSTPNGRSGCTTTCCRGRPSSKPPREGVPVTGYVRGSGVRAARHAGTADATAQITASVAATAASTTGFHRATP